MQNRERHQMCARRAPEVETTEEVVEIEETPVVHEGILGTVEHLAHGIDG